MKKKDSAFILPGALLIITLLFLAIAPLHDGMILALRASAEQSLAQQAENMASTLVQNHSFNFQIPPSSRQLNKCFTQTSKVNRISAKKTFCSSFHSPAVGVANRTVIDSIVVGGIQNLPSLDFVSLFRNSKECTSLGAQVISPIAISLSNGSAESSIYCQLKIGKILQQATFASNLKIYLPLNLSGDGSISIKGFLVTSSQITVATGKHSIVAGGDVLIDTLATSSNSELTVISASGNVKINKIIGPLRLRVYAAKKAILPANTKFSATGFQDLTLDYLPLGFRD